MRTKLYGLFDPKTGALRYIGKTGLLLRVRLNCHVSKAKKGRNHLHNWIRKVGRPVIELLEEVEGSGSEAEVQMIAFARLMKTPLVNYTAGGEAGAVGYKHTDEARLRMRLAKLGKRQSEEHRGRRLAASLAEDAQARRKESLRRHYAGGMPEEQRQKISAGCKKFYKMRDSKMPSSSRF